MASQIDIVTKDSVNRSVTLRIIDSTDGTPETGVVFDTSGIDLWSRREGEALVSITEADLAALTTAHTDGGFLHISDGEYRFDSPDAAFATGVNYVDFGGTVTGMVVIGGRVRLTDLDLETVMRGTDSAALATALVTAQVDLDTLTDGLILQTTTIATLASQTSFTLTAGSADNDAYNGATIVVIDASTATQKAFGSSSDYTGVSKTVTLAQDPGIFTMAVGDTVHILPSDVFAIWDRVLTGATHNVPTSAARRLRGLTDFGLYDGGKVYISTVNGTAGTVDFENATVNRPSDTLTDAATVSASIGGFYTYNFSPGSSWNFLADLKNSSVEAVGSTLQMGGFDFSGTHIFHATVSGNILSADAEVDLAICEIGSVTVNAAHFEESGLLNTVTLGAVSSDVKFTRCYSLVAGSSTPILDFGTATANHDVTFAGYDNGIEIRNFNATVGGGTDTLSLSGHGQLIVASTCDGGTVNLRGMWKVTDNSGGAVAFTKDDNSTNLEIITGTTGALLDPTATSAQLVDDNWDEVITTSAHNGANSAGKLLRQSRTQVARESAVDDPGAAATTTVFNTDLTDPDDFWNDHRLIFKSGSLAEQTKPILAYTLADGQITLDEALTSIPADGDEFTIVSDHIHPVTQIAAGIWDRLQSASATAGTFGEIATEIATLLVDTTAIKSDLPQVPTTGVAFTNFTFLMVLASDHVTPATGLTFLAADSQRSIDGAAFANSTNTPTEISAGVYTVDLSAADMAGSNSTTLKFTGTAADQRTITLPMQPT